MKKEGGEGGYLCSKSKTQDCPEKCTLLVQKWLSGNLCRGIIQRCEKLKLSPHKECVDLYADNIQEKKGQKIFGHRRFGDIMGYFK